MKVKPLERQYWKIKDFADHFGLDKSTVYNQIERGEIRAIRVGKTALRIPTDEVKRILDSFVEPQRAPTPPVPPGAGLRSPYRPHSR